jgi:hypothetical protein
VRLGNEKLTRRRRLPDRFDQDVTYEETEMTGCMVLPWSNPTSSTEYNENQTTTITGITIYAPTKYAPIDPQDEYIWQRYPARTYQAAGREGAYVWPSGRAECILFNAEVVNG